MIDGRIKIHTEIPEERITFNSLFLLSLMNVCIELNRKTVGKIIGSKEGKWSNAIFRISSKGISFEDPRLNNSIRSIVKKRKQQKKVIVKKDIKFCLVK